MHRGAVVMLDALGFKGIWDRKDAAGVAFGAQRVFDKLRSLRTSAEEDTNGMLEDGTLIGAAPIAFLSDTIVLGVVSSEVPIMPAVKRATELLSACYRASRILEVAVRDEPPLAFRGCIAWGAFDIDGSFLIGPAIDEAAELHERADGALVWMAPSAKANFEVTQKGRRAPTPVLPWRVPLKGGHSYETYALSPFANVTIPSDRKAIRDLIMSTFPPMGDVGIQIKGQHTGHFLDHALKLHSEWDKSPRD